MLQSLLFSDEAPLTDAVEGTFGFARQFEVLSPIDKQVGSLRQFDLHRRMFKYPRSYLIYFEAIDALPQPSRIPHAGNSSKCSQGKNRPGAHPAACKGILRTGL